jgi:hypothetical protein
MAVPSMGVFEKNDRLLLIGKENIKKPALCVKGKGLWQGS